MIQTTGNTPNPCSLAYTDFQTSLNLKHRAVLECASSAGSTSQRIWAHFHQHAVSVLQILYRTLATFLFPLLPKQHLHVYLSSLVWIEMTNPNKQFIEFQRDQTGQDLGNTEQVENEANAKHTFTFQRKAGCEYVRLGKVPCCWESTSVNPYLDFRGFVRKLWIHCCPWLSSQLQSLDVATTPNQYSEQRKTNAMKYVKLFIKARLGLVFLQETGRVTRPERSTRSPGC